MFLTVGFDNCVSSLECVHCSVFTENKTGKSQIIRFSYVDNILKVNTKYMQRICDHILATKCVQAICYAKNAL
jgi:hypothetical protein